MNSFWVALMAELAARRRRMRELLGDRGAAIAEFLIMAGLLAGSLGLFLTPWMAGAAPWGFGVPVVFALGFLLIEARRQGQIRGGADPEPVAVRYDWFAQLFAFTCALAGAAAFVIALGAKPVLAVDPWAPPPDAILTDIAP